MLPGALAFVVAAVPALAQKEIVVDYDAARVYPLEDGRLARSPIRANNREEFAWKDIGTFRISEKIADKRSNLYNIAGDPIQPGDEGARMRFWMRLGGSAQGFHLSALFKPEGSPHRSHGCYRLSRKSAMWLFDWTPVGTPVHVVRKVKESRYAGILPPQQPVVARRVPVRATVASRGAALRPPTAVKPASRPAVAAKPAPRPAVAAKPAPRPAVTVKPASRPAVTVRPAPRPAVTVRPAERPATARVTIRRLTGPWS